MNIFLFTVFFGDKLFIQVFLDHEFLRQIFFTDFLDLKFFIGEAGLIFLTHLESGSIKWGRVFVKSIRNIK